MPSELKPFYSKSNDNIRLYPGVCQKQSLASLQTHRIRICPERDSQVTHGPSKVWEACTSLSLRQVLHPGHPLEPPGGSIPDQLQQNLWTLVLQTPAQGLPMDSQGRGPNAFPNALYASWRQLSMDLLHDYISGIIQIVPGYLFKYVRRTNHLGTQT